MTTTRIAQFSDCHLFSSENGLHYGANVYENLCTVLNDIANDKSINFAIFTGDLTQDHTEQSYQLFMKAVTQSRIAIPLYFLSGNHDDTALMTQILSPSDSPSEESNYSCLKNKIINTPYWQIALINSKSDTPAGIVDEDSLKQIHRLSTNKKHTLLCMHHHPIDVGFGIDKHGLLNKSDFWQAIDNNIMVKGVLCGHVHNAFTFEKKLRNTINGERNVTVYTCPATSVEFNKASIKASEPINPVTEQGPGYQVVSLFQNGSMSKEIKYFPANF